MADAWIIVTDPFDGTERKLALKDNGDGYYSIATQDVGLRAALADVGTDELRIDLIAMGGSVVSADHLTIIDWPLQRVRDKKAFTTHFENDVTSIGEMTVIAFNAPAATKMYMEFTVQSTHRGNAFVYRDTSIDVDEGTQLTVRCRNQVAPLGTSAVTSIETTPVINKLTSFNEVQAAAANITTTTKIDQIIVPGGIGPKAIGATERPGQEFVFSDSTQVAVMLVALTNDAANHLIRVDWYEED
jgi:hypothetical protein